MTTHAALCLALSAACLSITCSSRTMAFVRAVCRAARHLQAHCSLAIARLIITDLFWFQGGWVMIQGLWAAQFKGYEPHNSRVMSLTSHAFAAERVGKCAGTRVKILGMCSINMRTSASALRQASTGAMHDLCTPPVSGGPTPATSSATGPARRFCAQERSGRPCR